MSSTAQHTSMQNPANTPSPSNSGLPNYNIFENDDTEGEQHDGSNHEEEDWSESGSVVSETPTVEKGQESFDTFQKKVRKLFLGLWPGVLGIWLGDLEIWPGVFGIWPGVGADSVIIERLQGGAFNRVIAVTIFKPMPKAIAFFAKCFGRRPMQQVLGRYILRIPRTYASALIHQIKTLEYVAQRVSYPVPRVISYDTTGKNAVHQAYMVQERLPGRSLMELWPELSLEQKKSAVSAITKILLQLREVTNPCAGIISKDNTFDDPIDGVRLEQIPVPRAVIHAGMEGVKSAPASPQTTRDYLISLGERERGYVPKEGVPYGYGEVWDGLAKTTNRMHQLGLLPDEDAFHLYHGDFHVRNILVEITSPSTVNITGILDWDSAVFAPKFMSTRAPFFLWADEGAHDNDEDDAVLEPSCAEKAQLKRIFEEVAGPDFTRLAYDQSYILARKMYHILTIGIRNDIDMGDAEKIVEKFEELHPSSG